MKANERAGEVIGMHAQNQIPADDYIGGLSSLLYRSLLYRPANEDLIRGMR